MCRAAAACSVALLVACSTTRDSAELRPAELTEIRPALVTRVAWQVAVGSGGGGFLQPAVVENAVFAAAAGGGLVRVAPETGRIVWRTDTGARLSAGVGSDGFTVAVATRRGEVLAYDADGRLRWRAPVSSDVTTPPLVGRGLVVVRSTDHQVTAFGAEDGRRRWVFQRSAPPLTLRAPTEMAFAADSALVGLPGGRLVAVALANGAARWEAVVAEPKGATEVERLADVVGPVGVATGASREACAAAFQGRITCVDIGNGALRWPREWPAGSGVALDERRVFAVDARSHVGAFAIDNGASVWRNERLANRRLTTPLALPAAVVVGDYRGFLHFLAPADGEFVARIRVDSSPITATPQPWADGLIALTQDGTLARIVVER
jgi:outer membrane protein assembly factor BamB